MTSAEAIAQDAKERQAERAQTERRGLPPAKKVAIATLTPTLGKVSMWWHTCMLDMLWPMNTGRTFIPTFDAKGGQVGEMRNRLVQMALTFEQQQNVDLQYLFWIDDDVIFSRACLLQLLSHDRDIVSGVYFAKGEPTEPLIFSGPGSGTMKFKPNEQFEAWGWAQGLSIVRASIYKQMRDEMDIGVDCYGNPSWYKQPGFEVDARGSLTLGGTEDFIFFDRCNKLGYRCLVDCTRHAFAFHYDLSKSTAYPAKQWEQYVHREPIIWRGKDGSEVIWD